MEITKILENIEFFKNKLGYREPQIDNIEKNKAAEIAYKGYKQIGCEYGVITSLSETLKIDLSFEEVLAVKRELPHKWNHICGAITGSFVISGLTLLEEKVENAVKTVIDFHNFTNLPIYKGDNTILVPAAKAKSIKCRDSIINWSKETGIPIKSEIRSERCARITVDIALKTLELITQYFTLKV